MVKNSLYESVYQIWRIYLIHEAMDEKIKSNLFSAAKYVLVY